MNIQHQKVFTLLTHKIASLLSWFGLFTAPAKTADYNIQDIAIKCNIHQTRQSPHDKAQIKHAISLTSDDEDFGGLSGILLSKDKKKFYALSDRARFFHMTPIFDKDKNITCFSSAQKRPLRGRSTRALIGHHGDSEGLSFKINDENKVLISFERAHRVVEYNLSMDQLLPQTDYEALSIRELPYNKSFETVRMISKDEIIAFPEGHEVKKGFLKGYLYNLKDETNIDIALEKYDGHYITDINILNNGDYLTLERRLSLLTGISTVMRHVKKNDLLSGNPASGNVVFHMTSTEGGDNFEAMEIQYNETMNHIYIVSDNNFTSFQKTLLLHLEYDFEQK